MSVSPSELIPQLEGIQPRVWQAVSKAVTHSAGQPIQFSDGSTSIEKTTELYADVARAEAVVQFAFSNTPEHRQVVIISEETLKGLASYLKPDEDFEVDEDLVTALRPVFESIVQGICIAAGAAHAEPVVASGLTIRYENFTFPRNFQKADELVRCRATIVGDEPLGEAVWLMDLENAAFVVGLTPKDSEKEMPKDRALPEGSPAEGVPGLDILMDIPLEIGVELGRTRMLVREVLELGTGSIVELNRVAGEPIDVMVNGRLVARGEVVVIEDNFGVRITEILSPFERLQRMNEAA